MKPPADDQAELYIRQLEQAAQTLFDQSDKFRECGLNDLADEILQQAEQLKRAIGRFRKVIES